MFSQLKNRYERRNLLAILWMAIADVAGWILSRLFKLAPIKATSNGRLRKVLLVNPAHIGDVVISTAAIRRIKEWDTSIEIGFVIGSWASAALENHPGIDHLYIVDHWKLNRSTQNWLHKFKRYLLTWWKTRNSLIKEGYDTAILLNSFTPNLSSLLWASHISTRVGYTSAGMTSLLNLVANKPDSTNSEQSIQLQLLTRVGIHGDSRAWLDADLITSEQRHQLGIDSPYIVLHPGTGNPAKAWPTDKWQYVARSLHDQGFGVVVTGHGHREKILADQICQNSSAINLVNQLQWSEWKSVLASASLVIGVDSAAGHISAALNKSFIGIYSGVGGVARWSPVGSSICILNQAMPCSPCHTRPCAERPCITSISTEQVLNSAHGLLK